MLIAGMVTALSGCTQPAVTPKPFALQERENNLRDWTAVGKAIADRMADKGLLTARVTQPVARPPVAPARYYVNLIRPGIPFLREVRDALQAEILARGSAVSTTPADSVVVNLDLSWVRWDQELGAPGGALSLEGLAAGGGIILGANGPYSPAAGFGMAAGLGMALDLIKSLTPNTNVEVAWKATIVQGDTYVMEAGAPVYVRAGDLQLYSGHDSNRLMTSYEPKAVRTPVQLRFAP